GGRRALMKSGRLVKAKTAVTSGLLLLVLSVTGCSSTATLELRYSEKNPLYVYDDLGREHEGHIDLRREDDRQEKRALRMMPVPGDIVAVPTVATSVRSQWLQSPSIVAENSVAVFKVEPGNTIPGHPQATRIRLRCDYFHVGHPIEIGRPMTFRFTP